MPRIAAILSAVALFCSISFAQTPSRPHIVRAAGHAVVTADPDEARLNVGVVTKAPTADEAASRNATEVETVLVELRRMLGPAAEIRTVNYSLNPNYSHQTGREPILTGYTASNVVEVKITDLTLIGKVIDAAIEAGATNVHGLRFTIQNPEPLRAEALGLAARQARAHAAAMAAGLHREIGAVLMVSDSSSSPGPVLADVREVAAAANTPIEAGPVEIRANVVIEAELK